MRLLHANEPQRMGAAKDENRFSREFTRMNANRNVVARLSEGSYGASIYDRLSWICNLEHEEFSLERSPRNNQLLIL